MSNQSTCKNCGQTIFWQKAQSGKNYPTNSADNRRDFHQCAVQGTVVPRVPAATTSTVKAPATAVAKGKTLDERLTWLEQEVRKLRKLAIEEPAASTLATDEDIPF